MRVVRRAAARVGCTIKSLSVRQTSTGPRAVGQITCTDGWAAARMLLAEGVEYAKLPGVRDAALQLRQGAIDDLAFARAVHQYVKDNVAFAREKGEIFQGPAYTLEA